MVQWKREWPEWLIIALIVAMIPFAAASVIILDTWRRAPAATGEVVAIDPRLEQRVEMLESRVKHIEEKTEDNPLPLCPRF